jgi:serine/threonine protein kinase
MRLADPVAVHRVHVPRRKRGVNVIVHVIDGNDTDRDVFGVPANDEEVTEEVTEAFDRIDNAYDALEVREPESRQTMARARHDDPDPEAARSRSCGYLFSPGSRIGKYELEEKLGQGTFGVVHTARDTELDRRVALKILNPSHNDNDDILHRFLQEGRAAARVSHPGIITVLDSGRFTPPGGGEIAYIAMERLEGESLASRLKRSGRLAPETAAEIGRQVASALDAAHRAGVLHRDLKPDNIYLVPDTAVAAGERVKVLDFGLAKLANASTTALNTVFGTPRYMSPEQCRSSGMIDQRSDIYALGCILFELVTGRTPFEGELYKIIEKHLRTPPPRVRALAPEVPPALDGLINRMLAKDAVSRPGSMAEVESALRGAGAESPGAATTLAPGSFQKLVLQPLFDEQVTRARELVDDRSIILLDQVIRKPTLSPTTHSPTPTHVIHPLQRRRSLAPLVAIGITVAIGILLSLASALP